MKIGHFYLIIFFIIFTLRSCQAVEKKKVHKTYKILRRVLRKIDKFSNALNDLKKVINKKSNLIKPLPQEDIIILDYSSIIILSPINTTTKASTTSTTTTTSTTSTTTSPSTSTSPLPPYVFTMSPKCSKTSDLNFKLSKQTCKKDSKLFDADGSLIIKEEMGGIYKSLNYTYFFGREVKTFDESYATCCKLGMTMVDINSEQKMLDTYKAVKEIQKVPKAFWTSGRGKLSKQKTCYWWISTNSLVEPQIPWLRDEPFSFMLSSEDVLAIYVSKEVNGVFSAQPDTRYLTVCQGDPNINIKSPSPGIYFLAESKNAYYKPKVKQNVNNDVIKQMEKICTQMQAMFKGNAVYKNLTNETISKYEDTKSICGRQYMISKTQVKYNTIIKLCSDINMVPLIVTSSEELKCLAEDQKGWPKAVGKSFYWLMGMDLNLNQSFSYCSQKIIPVPEELWFPGRPSSVTGMDNKLCLGLWKEGIGRLFDATDFKMQYYICEDKAQQLEKIAKL